MKFEHNPKYNTMAIYALVVLILAMVFYQGMQSIGVMLGLLGRILSLLTPLIYGVVFAFLLNPLLRLLDDRLLSRALGNSVKPVTRRAFALIITYLIALTLVAAFFRLVLPQIIYSLGRIFSGVSGYIESLTRLYDTLMEWLQDALGASTIKFTDDLSNMLLRFILSIENTLYTLPQRTITTLYSITAGLAAGIIKLFLGLIVSIYILMDREKLFAQIKKLGTALFPPRAYQLLYDISMDISRVFSGFVIGKVIDSFIIGILCFIGMSFINPEYAVFISVVIGVTNVIPYFGPFIGAIPSIILLLTVSPVTALIFGVFILALQQVDGNIIGPKILGDTVGLSPLWIIFSITLFSGLLGILGMFIGVPLFAVIYSLVRRITSFLLERKGESTNTRDYASDTNPMIK